MNTHPQAANDAGPHFRVEADWPGGGIGYTIPAADEKEARAWADHRARFHREVVVRVTPREMAASDTSEGWM